MRECQFKLVKCKLSEQDNLRITANIPFNLPPIFCFEKMGAFENEVELNLKKAGFHKVKQKKKWVPAQKKIWLVVDLIFKFMP